MAAAEARKPNRRKRLRRGPINSKAPKGPTMNSGRLWHSTMAANTRLVGRRPRPVRAPRVSSPTSSTDRVRLMPNGNCPAMVEAMFPPRIEKVSLATKANPAAAPTRGTGFSKRIQRSDQ